MRLPYYIADCDRRGIGVFAGKTFLTGEFILRFTGVPTRFENVEDFTHFLQISPDTFLGPSGQPDDFVNHSCDPNCAVYLEDEGPVLRALRGIVPGEELAFDYGTIMFSEPTEFDCYCGTARCRKRIGSFGSMPVELQEYYLANNAVPLLSRFSLEELGYWQGNPAAGKARQSSLPAE